MKFVKFLLSAILLASGAVLCAAPVVRVCNGSGSTDVKFSVEYSRPYWVVGRGRSTTDRMFRYDEKTRRIVPPFGGQRFFELKTSTPNRLVDANGKVVLEYRNGSIYKPGNSSPVGSYRNGALYKGSGTMNCVANFRGKVPVGLVLAIAANYYLHKELGFTPADLTPKKKVVTTNIFVLDWPFDKKEHKTTFYAGEKKDGKVLYTFHKGMIYKGADLKSKPAYVVALGRFALLGKAKKKYPYIVHFHDNANFKATPDYVFQALGTFALHKGGGVHAPVYMHFSMRGNKIFAGSQKKDVIGCLSRRGDKLYRGSKPEGTPLLTIEGNRQNMWAEMFIFSQVLKKDIDQYHLKNPDADKPFPKKQKK